MSLEQVFAVDGPFEGRVLGVTPGEATGLFDAEGTSVRYTWDGGRNDEGLRTFRQHD